MPPKQNKTTISHTPYGPVVIVWRSAAGGPRILRLLLSSPGSSALQRVSEMFPQARESPWQAVSSKITRFLFGKPVTFDLAMTNLSRCSTFQQRVLQAEHAIPRGRVSSYQRIARHLGVPKGARAVGNALAHNPFPLIVPCHRAIRSDGSLGGFKGGMAMKRALLLKEGISLSPAGHVRHPCWHYG